MTKCPVCDTELTRVFYEGVAVMQCDHCSGHLMPVHRVESIKRTMSVDREHLEAQSVAAVQSDTLRTIHCPRCHAEMEKRPLPIPMLDIVSDVCRPCGLSWLDGGELALMQLVHEAAETDLNQSEVHRRVDSINVDPERKAVFEQQMKTMRGNRSAVATALRDLLGNRVCETLDDCFNALLEALRINR